MAKKTNTTLQIAGFIGFLVLALSGFEYLENGHIDWYKAPLNAAQEALPDQNNTSPAEALSAIDSIEFTGRVSSITDGDTLRIINSQGESQVIRLYGIDAPERDQPYGSQATNALRQKLSNAQVRIVQQDIDDYGRYIGTIYLDERNINLELVAQGHAWWYEFFAPTNRELEQAQSDAQDRNLGLWNSPKPIDPYEWRRSH